MFIPWVRLWSQSNLVSYLFQGCNFKAVDNPGVCPQPESHKLIFMFEKSNGNYGKAGQCNQKAMIGYFYIWLVKNKKYDLNANSYKFLNQCSVGTWQMGRGREGGRRGEYMVALNVEKVGNYCMEVGDQMN